MNSKLRSTFTVCLATLVAATAMSQGQITYVRQLPNGTLKLHQMTPNGTNDTTINFPFALVGFPTWSKDGSQLAVTAFQPSKIPTHTWNVFSLNQGRGAARKLTDFTDILQTNPATFSYTFPWYKAYSPQPICYGHLFCHSDRWS